jgi:Ulp1 family protease
VSSFPSWPVVFIFTVYWFSRSSADEATQVRALKLDPSRASSTTAPPSSTSILAKLAGSVKGTIDTISHLFSADRSPPKLRQTKITRMDATETSSDHESNAMSTQFRTSSRRKSLLQQSARDAEVVVQLSGGETDTALNHASDDNGRSDRRSTRGTAQLLQHQRQETKRLAAERKAKLLLSYPFEESSRVGQITITYGDIDRLKPGEFLNDSIIDFYLRSVSKSL